MRIDAYNQIAQIHQANSKLKTQQACKAGSLDKVEISGIGKDIQVVTQALKNVPDVREEKVAELKAAIGNGTYEVSDEDFVQKFLKIVNENI